MIGVDAATVLKRVPNGVKADIAYDSGDTHSAVVASISEEKAATVYGMDGHYAQSVYVDTSEDGLNEKPQVGKRLQIVCTYARRGTRVPDGTTYRVLGVHSYNPSTLSRIDLGQLYAE